MSKKKRNQFKIIWKYRPKKEKELEIEKIFEFLLTKHKK
jgi:hypothetical protein